MKASEFDRRFDEGEDIDNDVSWSKAHHPNRGHYLREWRKFAGLSQEEVGAALKMKRQTIARIENGKSEYTQSYLEGLAGLIGCEVIDLIRRPPDGPGGSE